MKSRILDVCCLGLLAIVSLQDTKPGKSSEATKVSDPREVKVREIMELTGTAAIGQQLMAQLVKDFKRMSHTLPKGFLANFEALAKPEEVVDMVVPIYLKHLDDETLTGALAFLSSDVGKRWSAAQAQIIQDAQSVGRTWGRKLGQRIMRDLRKKAAAKIGR